MVISVSDVLSIMLYWRYKDCVGRFRIAKNNGYILNHISRFYLLMLICSLLSVGKVLAADWLGTLSQPYQRMQSQLSVNPNQVLSTLLDQSIDNNATATEQAQYHLLLSQTYYMLTYPHEALQEAKTGLMLVDQRQQIWLYHQLRLAQALAYDGVGTPAKGMTLVNAAMDWAEKQQDRAVKLDALYVRAALLTSLVDYPSALSDLQQANELVPQQGSTISKGQVASAIALVYEYRREAQLSIPYFEQAVNYHQSQDEWQELSIALYGLGRANKNIGKTELGRSQLTQSAEIAQQVNDVQGVAYALKELAGLNISEQHFVLAEKQLLEAQEIFDRANNPYMQLDVASSLLELALATNQPERANQYLLQARYYLDPETMPIQKIALDEQAARVTALMGNYPLAYEQLEQTVKAKQKIYNQQSTEQLHQLRSQYELETKEQKNQLLERQNQLQKMSLAAQQRQYINLWVMFGFALLICLLLAILVYRNQQNKRRLIHLANVDGLTGLLNRRKALEMLQLQFDLAQRHKFPLCVVIIDLDLFKQINDKFGHAIGDKVLQGFGQLCLATFRHTDVIGRIGGEEFLIALPHTEQPSAESLLHSLSHQVQAMAASIEADGLMVSISCGLAMYQDQSCIEELMTQADNALYQAKLHGRNRVEIFMPNTSQHLLPV
ncbi:diguanylate cyclase [Neptunicella sp.]|uniref:GGDEF domain-containing protein n=1 Tax=Neptunicella sp. TaxID=2125986 RepID=UPI003F690853